jgi:parallel beta-helix repeat protein
MNRSISRSVAAVALLLLIGWGLMPGDKSLADDPADTVPAETVPVENAPAAEEREPVSIYGKALAQARKLADKPAPLEDFSTEALQTLVEGVKDGTTLKAPRGRYTSKKAWTIKNKKNLTLIFTPDSEVICDDVYEDVVRIEDSDGVRLVGGIFRHAEPLKEYECHGAVIRIDDCESIKLMNGEYNGCGAVGVLASNVKQLTVYNCTIHRNSWTGLYLQDVQNARIVGNHIHDNKSDMTLVKCGMIQSDGNKIENNADYWQNAAKLQKELKQLHSDPKIITPVPEEPEKR